MRLYLLLVALRVAAQDPDGLERLKCGDLNRAEQRAYEDRLVSNPNDQNARSCLLVQAQLQKDWPNVARHTEWVIDNFANLPEAPGVIRSARVLRTAEPTLFAGIERKLREAIQQKSSVGLLIATASLVAEHDPALALTLLEGAYTGDARDAALSSQLGQIYARDFLRGASSSRAILSQSRDPYLLRAAAAIFNAAAALEHRGFASTLLDQADQVQPRRPVPIGPVPIAADALAAQLSKHVPPVYPEAAREAGLVGQVTFEAIVTPQGKVRLLTVVSGASVFVRAAQDAAYRWEYRPTILNGSAVEVSSTIVVKLFPPE